jgi:hypothetical protein
MPLRMLAASSSRPVSLLSGRKAHAASAAAERAIATMSNRLNGTGRRPGFSRASQLRVKLGMMRPPMIVISRIAAPIPSLRPMSEIPEKCA